MIQSCFFFELEKRDDRDRESLAIIVVQLPSQLPLRSSNDKIVDNKGDLYFFVLLDHIGGQKTPCDASRAPASIDEMVARQDEPDKYHRWIFSPSFSRIDA